MKIKKEIRKSNRGLTFSFDGVGTKFEKGSKFSYILDKKNNKVYISPSNNDNSLTVSKKKSGSDIKSLIDIRKKEVLSIFNDADYIQVTISENQIVAEGFKETLSSKICSTLKTTTSNKVIDITKKLKHCKRTNAITLDLSLLDKVAGDSLHYTDTAYTSFVEVFNVEEDVNYSSWSKPLLNGLEKALKVYSVFSGAGMMDKCLKDDKDFEIVQAIEYDPAACSSYRENIGDIVIQMDIRNVKIEDIPYSEILWGGTVCKPYSNANRRSREHNHKDSDLLDEFIRLAKGNFKVFVLENVAEILTLQSGYYMNKIKEELSDYDITPIIIRDDTCGGYTTRKRAFIIGSRIGKVYYKAPDFKAGTVGEALSKVNSSWYNFSDVTKPRADTEERMNYIPMGGNWRDLPKRLWQSSYSIGKTHSNTLKRLDINKPCVTLANFRKCNLIHPFHNRGLTVAEASSISGFEKDFKLIGSLAEKQMQIANGVCYRMAHYIKNIVKSLFYRQSFADNISFI